MSITKLHTADDLFLLGSDARCELIEGELHDVPGSGLKSSVIGGDIMFAIGLHLRGDRIGIVSGEAGGYLLSRAPDTVVFPDVAFIRTDRLPGGGVPEGFCPVPPDLAVEVVSPTDRLPDAERKVRRYLDAGTPLAWLVDPASRSVAVHRPGRPVRALGVADVLDGGDVLPGFMLPVAEIFAL